MKHRTTEIGEYVEVDGGREGWRACSAERAELALRWRALAAEMDGLQERFEVLALDYGLRDTSRNGTVGAQKAHGIWRLFRTTANSAKNLARELVK